MLHALLDEIDYAVSVIASPQLDALHRLIWDIWRCY